LRTLRALATISSSSAPYACRTRTSCVAPLLPCATVQGLMCSGSEAGSYLRLIDFVYHLTLGLRVIKKKKSLGLRVEGPRPRVRDHSQRHPSAALREGSWLRVEGSRPRVQRYLAHKKPPHPRNLRLGLYGDPSGVGVSYERGTSVKDHSQHCPCAALLDG